MKEPLIWASEETLVGKSIPCEGVLYQRLVQPLLLAALNVDPPEGSAGLAGAIVRETLLAGGQACRPLIARESFSVGMDVASRAWTEMGDAASWVFPFEPAKTEAPPADLPLRAGAIVTIVFNGGGPGLSGSSAAFQPSSQTSRSSRRSCKKRILLD